MSSRSESSATKEQASDVVDRYTKEMVRCKVLWTGFEGFEPAPTDIFVTSFLKSGTTLTQQLVYQLLVSTGHVPADPKGDNFDNITSVVPTIELRNAFGVHKAVHEFTPRIWKSHGTANDFEFIPPSSGKFIYCVRNGVDAGRSFLDFTLDWILSKEQTVRGAELRAEVYRQWFMCYFLGLRHLSDGGYEREPGVTGDWFTHVDGWIKARRDNLYFLIYEDVVRDVPKAVQEVADFLGVEVSPAAIDNVVSKCDREFMAKDPRFIDTMVSDAMGWDREGGIRVRLANAPGFKDVPLPDEGIAMFNEMFHDTFGLKDYEDLIGVLRARNSARRRHTCCSSSLDSKE